ncbi:MAG: hydrogenase iron-sulfur subunit [Candidatus Kariarchaeaceae archaeon]|jgi:F420-non-reducing hydrogenase iron-sulfur subunit
MTLTETVVKEEIETLQTLKPKILGFVCNWCSYAGADNAGQLHLDYPVNVRLIRTMCSGRVDPTMLLQALKTADLVFVSGCHLPNDCHYKTGNHFARARVEMTRKLIEDLGISPERCQILYVSPAEAKEFAQFMEKLQETARLLGPNPMRLYHNSKNNGGIRNE